MTFMDKVRKQLQEKRLTGKIGVIISPLTMSDVEESFTSLPFEDVCEYDLRATFGVHQHIRKGCTEAAIKNSLAMIREEVFGGVKKKLHELEMSIHSGELKEIQNSLTELWKEME